MNLSEKILDEQDTLDTDTDEIDSEDNDTEDNDTEDNFFDEPQMDIPNKKVQSKAKLKNSSTDYGKISTAIGKMKKRGIEFSLPDINKSTITFSPDEENNRILFGLRGIQRVGNQLIKEIFEKRPFTDIFDFSKKIKVNKTQMINLIKAGVFDNLYSNKNRYEIMDEYLLSIADQKKRITLQNMQMLIGKHLLPKELDFERRVFNFNRYLKKFKSDNYFILDAHAVQFYTTNYDESKLEDLTIEGEEQTAKIKQNIWDNYYQKAMTPVRNWIKENQNEILSKLNTILLSEIKNKYALGNLSKWEMDSLGFYYHDHELEKLKTEVYNISNFFELRDNEIDRTFKSKKTNEDIVLYKIHRIAGTVIDKDKNKSIITLLTLDGVVSVKIWKNQYAEWDKQIFEKDADGTKHVLEKSFFTRGNKLIITGIKRDNCFMPKKYKDTEYPLFEKIIELDDRGFITESATERVEVSN